jgi:hypothetical protein
MKWFRLFVVLQLLAGCRSDKPFKKFYSGTDSVSQALLTMTVNEDSFYGQLEVRYEGFDKDSGEVRGERIGDTLKGRFRYIPYGRTQKIKPFVLLMRNDTLKYGTGSTWIYLNIPYIPSENLQFSDSSYQFSPIDVHSAKKMGLNVE